ncbi:type III secretion protein Q [Collimonas sp. PA-H2]|uniref:type III secretion system cytoplasmic ring protein SctQ n=1 Tax=Collimonas sp. PA-H2 TaxID=1881062 RepID=UPI000BF622E1|nr:type III secretion system cytoplasmic ring protein SctQ [Collimonas sp. PA-H2]PFH10317.1 type III secretion protein Q [Collimonas sp. PA-H2]
MPDCSAQFSSFQEAAVLAVGDLPFMSRQRVTLLRKIGGGCQTRLASPEGELTLALSMNTIAATSAEDALLITASYGVIAVTQGQRLLRALCGIDVGATFAATETGDWLRAAVLGRLQQTPFTGATDLQFGAAPHWPDPVSLCLTVSDQQHAVVTEIQADASVMLALLSRHDWHANPGRSAPWAGLNFPFQVLLARHGLDLAALQRLQAGDVIIPDSPRFDCQGVGTVDLGGLSIQVQYRPPGSLEIIKLEKKLDQSEIEYAAGAAHGVLPDAACELAESSFSAASDDDAVAQDGSAIGAASNATGAILETLEQLPLMLEFRLGQLCLSLGELRNLAAGCVLQLEGGSPSTVAIVACGRALGKGELVDAGGQLGIRITQWTAPQ